VGRLDWVSGSLSCSRRKAHMSLSWRGTNSVLTLRWRSSRWVPVERAQKGHKFTRLQSARVSPSQRFHAYSHALDTAEASTAALEDVCAPFDGEAPDAIFACAGTSTPKFFVEMTETDLTKGLTNGYWVQAWTAWVSVFFSCGAGR